MSDYLGWFDDHAKTPIPERIKRGAAAYLERFQVSPRVVIVSPAEAEGLAVEGITVIARPYVRPNNYQFGLYEPK